MARWRLITAHYLNVPGTEWEYKETDRQTGRQGRKVYTVPALLDPKDPADQNYPHEDAIIVCYAGKGMPKDIIFEGEPTPDMEPMDDEAREISASLAPKWKHPIESLPGQGFADSLLAEFQKQFAAMAAGIKPAQSNASLSGVSEEKFAALQEQVQALMEQNAQLMAKVAEREAAGRRA